VIKRSDKRVNKRVNKRSDKRANKRMNTREVCYWVTGTLASTPATVGEKSCQPHHGLVVKGGLAAREGRAAPHIGNPSGHTRSKQQPGYDPSEQLGSKLLEDQAQRPDQY
jgi:hypothetical protein